MVGRTNYRVILIWLPAGRLELLILDTTIELAVAFTVQMGLRFREPPLVEQDLSDSEKPVGKVILRIPVDGNECPRVKDTTHEVVLPI